MSPFKIIFGFGAKFLIVYILLLLLAKASGFEDKVRDFYASSTVSFYDNVIDVAKIQTISIEEDNKNLMYQIINKKRLEEIHQTLREDANTSKVKIETAGYKTNTNKVVLLPFLFLFSLIVAYPSNFRQKIIPLLLGFLLLWIFVFIQAGCFIIYAIDNSEQYFPTYELSNFSRYFIAFLENIFIEISYIFTTLIWILSCVRLEDFKIK